MNTGRWIAVAGLTFAVAGCGAAAPAPEAKVETSPGAAVADAPHHAHHAHHGEAQEAGAGGVHAHGEMHAVMSGGPEMATSVVSLRDVLARPGAVGLGAATGLDGEITIRRGEALLSRTRNVSFETERHGVDSGEGAAMLLVAYVDGWTEIQVPEDLDQAGFETFLAASATGAGLASGQPFPFELEGELSELRMHVLHGGCPMRPGAELGLDQQPFVIDSASTTQATIVGFHAEDSVGKMTHPGTTIHAHVVLTQDGEPLTGHVERFGVRAGSTLRLPTKF